MVDTVCTAVRPWYGPVRTVLPKTNPSPLLNILSSSTLNNSPHNPQLISTIYSISWWFSTTLCIQIKLLTKWFILVWLERRRSCAIPKLGNWNHLIWKWDNFFIPTPMRFIQLPGDSPPLYVSKSSFLQSDSSCFDENEEEVVIFPNKKTGITWFESRITSSY